MVKKIIGALLISPAAVMLAALIWNDPKVLIVFAIVVLAAIGQGLFNGEI